MKKFNLVLLLFLSLALISCKDNFRPKPLNIIPRPAREFTLPGSFTLGAESRILIGNQDSLKAVAQYLADFLKKHGGLNPKIIPIDNLQEIGKDIILRLAPETSKSNEGYQLRVKKGIISILANSPAGIFYGIQSLLQLFPPSFFSTSQHQQSWKIPNCFIKDEPRFSYRGMHLDVSRHFFPPSDIKKYIDMLAMYKFNTFHWHLTDDNGWRIEIKKYPKLTSVCAWRVNRENQPWRKVTPPKKGEKATYGGYYTQKEVRDIVKYAQDRFITIIPEIEMPGHSSEVFAAYPQYSCTGKKTYVKPGSYWPNTDIFCAGNDKTFDFIEDVLSEVIDLFPSKYIHIGGDEANKTQWKKCPKCQKRIKDLHLKNEEELQSYFIKRIEKFLISKHRKLIGWDEILEGGLAPEATVMSWRGVKGGIAAAMQGHDVIMCPGNYCYFDHYQANKKFQPVAIGGFTTLKKVYSYEPVPEVLNAQQAKHILGVQGNVWTEFIPNFKKVQYMTLPRMAALAEVGWTPSKRKNWPDFQRRINEHFLIYKALGYNYCPGSYQVDIVVTDSTSSQLNVSLQSEIYHPEIHYTLDSNPPTMKSKKYDKSFKVSHGTTIQAAVFTNGKLMEEPSVVTIK